MKNYIIKFRVSKIEHAVITTKRQKMLEFQFQNYLEVWLLITN